LDKRFIVSDGVVPRSKPLTWKSPKASSSSSSAPAAPERPPYFDASPAWQLLTAERSESPAGSYLPTIPPHHDQRQRRDRGGGYGSERAGTHVAAQIQRGEIKVLVPADILVKHMIGDLTGLRPGAELSITANRADDGAITATQITVRTAK